MTITTANAEAIRAAIPLARASWRELDKELGKAIEASGLLAIVDGGTARSYREGDISAQELFAIIADRLF
jgi:hypothetical protein